MDRIKKPGRPRPRAVAAAVLGAALVFSAVAAATPATARSTGNTARSASQGKTRNEIFFHSPSRNIYCLIYRFHGRASGRCDIKERNWSAPPRPRSCHLDYGNGAEVDPRGKGHFTCAGDTVIVPHHRALRYGHSIKLGAVKCTSRRTGMTCQSVKTGHGFMISREAVDFF
jgi:hypothetical protein